MANTPPKYFLRFFRWFCHPDYVEDIEGDLHERYARNETEKGKRKAQWSFYLDVLRLFRPSLIKPLPEQLSINTAMFKHNLLITYRSFLRDKSTLFINLIGLSTGLACLLMIYLWVNDELNIDAFHEKDAQLYQMMDNFYLKSGDIVTNKNTPFLLGSTLNEYIPEIESSTVISVRSESPGGMFSNGDKKMTARGRYATSNFFNTFSFDLIKGNTEDVLLDKKSIVISQQLAYKLFNTTEDIIGKTIEWDNPYRGGVFMVSGVFENIPSQSSLTFDFLLNMDVFLDVSTWAREWNATVAETFVLLREGADVKQLNQKIGAVLEKQSIDINTKRHIFFVEKYSQKYLYSHYENGQQAGGRIEYVRLFSLIGLFILLIASINFMNLSTARASTKLKQIGVKKTIGASKKNLIVQFLSEAILIVMISMIIAISLVAALLPQFNEITGKSLEFFQLGQHAWGLVGFVLVTGLIAGSYPAFFLSSLDPLHILKGKMQGSIKELLVRKGLVIFQFCLATVFILGVWIVNLQMTFLQNKNLGYDRENVLYFKRTSQKYDLNTFFTEMREIPGVINVTNLHGGSIVNNRNKGSGFYWDGETAYEDLSFMRPQVGYNFIETLGLELKEGRGFSEEYGDEQMKLVINEAAAKIIGEEGIVGKMIFDGDDEKQIIGVVKDFNIKSLHEEMEPCIMRFSPTGQHVMVKIQAGTEFETISKLENLYEEFHPDYSFAFTFLDEEYQKLYASESKVARLTKYFSVLAIIISCLGLLGLAAFTAERRTKEIGIRKVLGASSYEIVSLLSKDFTKMVGVGIIIALPISYFISQNWLQNFAYKIDIQWWYFALAAATTLAIAWITVALQTVKAANVNPVESLGSE